MLPPQQLVDVDHADGRLEERRAAHRFCHEAMGGRLADTLGTHALEGRNSWVLAEYAPVPRRNRVTAFEMTSHVTSPAPAARRA